ncbi:hypothetical protein HNQ91_002185 [Filimonas zeae]|nr:hypothetical protein [Filimonas zeae]MDR6339134.1 hypothetical protein [Filimonas zeae]
MQYFFSFLLLVFTLFKSFTLQAQYAVVRDKDGYVNVREDSAGDARIVDRISNQSLVCVWLNEVNDWSDVSYMKNGKEYSGYIHASRLVAVDSIPGVKLLKKTKHTGTTAVFQHDSIKVTIAVKPFVAKEHKFTYSDKAHTSIAKIDGKPYKGKDGEMPGTEFKSIEVQWGKMRSVFPASWIMNMCEIRASAATIYVDEKKQRIYLEMSSFSDGAGWYTVMWLWEKGEVKSRLTWTP